MSDDAPPGPAWVPAFPGQRPPFEPGGPYSPEIGNVRALQHGAYSARAIQPLALEIEATARANASWPHYLSDASYSPAITAWAWAEAVCVLLRRYIADQDTLDRSRRILVKTASRTPKRGGWTAYASTGLPLACSLTWMLPRVALE